MTDTPDDIKAATARIRGHLDYVKELIVRVEAERDAALARAEEAERLLSEYRQENGCTRGQRTTQWCAELAKLRRATRALASMRKP